MNRKVLIILGSIRPGRAGQAVADWVADAADGRDGQVDYEVVDLKEVNLPFMDEPVPPAMGQPYLREHTREWSARIDRADGFVFVTPEYNHGYSPVLKNALDYLAREWKDKPAAFVGYGAGGATHAIRQLREVTGHLGMQALEDQVGISGIWEAFDGDGRPRSDNVQGDLEALFTELERHLANRKAA